MLPFLAGLRLSKGLVRILAIVALVAVVVIGLQVRSCMRGNEQRAQDRVDAAQDDATLNSARDAIKTQGDVAANAQASEDLTARNREDIRNAQGADQSVDPAVRDAGLRSLCKRASFRDSPSGRLRCPPAP